MKPLFAIAALLTASAAPVPSLHVRDMAGAPVTIETSRAKATVVVFYSVLCPVSNEYNDRMSQLFGAYKSKSVQFAFVDSNSNESVAEIAKHAKLAEYPFPVYKDVRNAVADTLGAEATPEAFVLDATGVIRYRGYIDDARNEARVKVHGLQDAIDAVLVGKRVERAVTKSFGCTIKRARKSS